METAVPHEGGDRGAQKPAAPADLTPLRELNPFQPQIDKVLAAQTSFGRFVKPLVDKLKALPRERQTESMETFGLVYEFFNGRRLDFAGFGPEDALFLLTDPVGEIIRRPATNLQFCQMLDDAVKPSPGCKGEEDSKSLFLEYMRALSWSRFVADGRGRGLGAEIAQAYPDERIFIDTRKLLHEWKEGLGNHGVFALGMLNEAVDAASRMYGEAGEPISGRYREHIMGRKARNETDTHWPFTTDPQHAFDFRHNMMSLRSLVEVKLGKYEMNGSLAREASFMFVEDNPLDRVWEGILDRVAGLTRYAPAKDVGVGGPTAKEEARGCYSSAERALQAIGDNVAAGGKPPDLILSDIELGPGMNGIEFARRAHDRYPDAVILFLWTSNPDRYEGQIEGMMGREVAGAFNKRTFKPADFIQRANEELGGKKR